MKTIIFALLCIVMILFIASCGSRLPYLEPLDSPDDAATLIIAELLLADTPQVSDVRLFISATPSMIGFVDFVRETIYTSVSSRIIHDLSQRSGDMTIYRVDLDLPFEYKKIQSIPLLMSAFTDPHFYTYRALYYYVFSTYYREYIRERQVPGWYGLDDAYFEYRYYGSASDMTEMQQTVLDAKIQGLPSSTTALAINNFDASALNVLITDFYDFRLGGQRSFAQLSSQFLYQGLAVGVISILSGFSGELPDFRRSGEGIVVAARPSWTRPYIDEEQIYWGLRPFHILLAGSYSDVSDIIMDFPGTLQILYGAEYNELHYEAVLYHGAFTDSSFDPESFVISFDGDMYEVSFDYEHNTRRLNVRNQNGSINMLMRYMQNTQLDPRTLIGRDFIVNSVLRNVDDTTMSMSFASIHSLAVGNQLEINFDLSDIPNGTHILETEIYIHPPARQFNNLFNRREYSNLTNWSMLISPGSKFDLVGDLLQEADAQGSYLIDFPFDVTIGLEEFTRSLESAALSAMQPTKLATIKIVIVATGGQ